MRNHDRIGFILKNYLPTFCWQTSHEIVTFVEQVNEDIDENVIRKTISDLCKRGTIITRRPIKKFIRDCSGCIRLEYRRAA
jgi:hypothetical protein